MGYSARKFRFLGLFLFDSLDRLLENLVFIELKRRYDDDLFYYREKYEIDFYLPQTAQAFQVSYSLSEPETMKREITGLRSVLSARNLKEGTILTYDEETELPDDQYRIRIITVWKWLLKEG